MPNQQDSFSGLMASLGPLARVALLGTMGYNMLNDDYQRRIEAERAARAREEADRIAQMSAQDRWYYDYLQQNGPALDQYYDMTATQGVRPGQPIGWYF